MATVHACIFCSQTFTEREQLQEHFRQHGNNQTAKTKSRPSKSVAETSNQQIKCEICSQEFESVSRAIYHKFKKHKDVQVNYFCPWCGKQFPIKHTWETHVKTHSDETEPQSKLQCPDCETIFFNKTGLDYHRSSYHEPSLFMKNINTPPPSKKIYISNSGDIQSAYYCPICGQEYVVKYNLQKHIKEIHGKTYHTVPTDIIKCTICEAPFCNERAYNFHNGFHKPDDVYVTSEEMRLNIVTKVDQDFDLRRVRTLLPESAKPVKSLKAANRLLNNFSKKQMELSTSVGNISKFSPPPSDSSDSSETDEAPVKTYNRKKQSNDTKNAISLNEFMNMHREIFGDCDDANIIGNAGKSEKPVTVKTEKTAVNIKIEEDSSGESTSGACGQSLSEIKTIPIKNNTGPKGSEVKYLTREELEKLKSKGLIRIATKPQKLGNIKKIKIVENIQSNLKPTILNEIISKNCMKDKSADSFKGFDVSSMIIKEEMNDPPSSLKPLKHTYRKRKPNPVNYTGSDDSKLNIKSISIKDNNINMSLDTDDKPLILNNGSVTIKKVVTSNQISNSDDDQSNLMSPMKKRRR